MKINKITIKNISSFVDFNSDVELKKKTLLFGTNGSGKSTLSAMLQSIDNFISSDKSDYKEKELKEFLARKISKEANGQPSSIVIQYNNKDTFSLIYDPASNSLNLNSGTWYPVKVFNDKYTEKTIGNSININFDDNGIIVGEPNRQLDEAQKKRDGLVTKKSSLDDFFDETVSSSIELYSQTTKSSANVSEIISKERILSDECEFEENKEAKASREKLGFDKPEDRLTTLSYKRFDTILNVEQFTEVYETSISKPKLDKDKENLLLNYTDFFKNGISAFEKEGNDKQCPFCFQKWENSKEQIDNYQEFLNSTYNSQRDLVESLKINVKKVNDEIERINSIIDSSAKNVTEDGKKYDVNTDGYTRIEINSVLENQFLEAIKSKLDEMTLSIKIQDISVPYVNYYLKQVEDRNQIIQKIKTEISQITTKRKQANKVVSKQISREIWKKNENRRVDYKKTISEIKAVEDEIEELEKKEVNQDTICTIFNGLIDFLGLSEYQISSDKKLIIKLNKDYDISTEGNRISSAQRKILSICYFVAEMISEIKTLNELKNYILVFDDPVDSADYHYFHSITAMLENLEEILKRILNKSSLKLGQIMVFTHNSLLYDRLYKNFETKKTIQKVDNYTIMSRSEKTMNNYKIYLEYIIRFYKEPKKSRKDMIFIGTLIRRVLEILSNFNNLGSNDFSGYVVSIGKPKLALLANHLSHESFTKVLNPLNSEIELQEACKELFEVIERSHPVQYEYIKNEMLENEA